MKDITDLITDPPEAGSCQKCHAEPWQVIDWPATPFETYLCLPCFLAVQEEAKRQAERLKMNRANAYRAICRN